MHSEKQITYQNHRYKPTNINIKISLIVLTVLLQSVLAAESNLVDSTKHYQPFYGKMQYAGNMGLLSLGMGKFFFGNRFSVDFNYGYLPKWVNGTKVHTLGLKSAYHFWNNKNEKVVLGCYTGINIIYGISKNTYLKYPEYFPEWYYSTNAFHFNPFIGAKLAFPKINRKIKAFVLYSELGTVDYELRYALSNKEVKLYEIWNLCFGFTIPLAKQS